jgi:hypothetical protein
MLLAAMLAMVLMMAAPAGAQKIDFVGEDVLAETGGAAVIANPNIGGAGFTAGAFAGASPQFGYFVVADGICLNTTPFDVC